MKRIVVSDLGGTHIRLAVATLGGRGGVELSAPLVLRTDDYPSFEAVWEEYAGRQAEPLPRELSVAFAGPVGDSDLLQLTNNSWALQLGLLKERLGLTRITVLNDFAAVAHAVAELAPGCFRHLCGPDVPLPEAGIITVVGPGTGLGVAGLLRRPGRAYDVIHTEGGHADFAPLDSVEDRILAELRTRFGRVSVERLLSGSGLVSIYGVLSGIEQRPPTIRDERELWTRALNGSDPGAAAALDRFCLCLGAVAGDLALMQGAAAVVIGGGLGLRLSDHLHRSGFGDRFVAKGRFEQRMRETPVKLITHPEPGLYGAAVAAGREPPAP